LQHDTMRNTPRESYTILKAGTDAAWSAVENRNWGRNGGNSLIPGKITYVAIPIQISGKRTWSEFCKVIQFDLYEFARTYDKIDITDQSLESEKKIQIEMREYKELFTDVLKSMTNRVARIPEGWKKSQQMKISWMRVKIT
jgi:hypothetical protein